MKKCSSFKVTYLSIFHTKTFKNIKWSINITIQQSTHQRKGTVISTINTIISICTLLLPYFNFRYDEFVRCCVSLKKPKAFFQLLCSNQNFREAIRQFYCQRQFSIMFYLKPFSDFLVVLFFAFHTFCFFERFGFKFITKT